MAYFQTKNPNFGKFWRDLQWKMLVYLMSVWSILRHLVYLVFISFVLWSFDIDSSVWCILPRFGVFYLSLLCCNKKNLATLQEALKVQPKCS
jgi:hypothetical protein